jgi:hypothetical protein
LKLKRKRKKEQFKMFAKNKVSQSMIDAVNSVISEGKVEEASEKVPTPTGMKVYGSSYGNSKKARADQTKSAVDNLKGPKDKEMKQEELKGNQHKIDKNKNNKIDAHDFKILRGEKKVSEESEKEDSCEDEAKQEVKKHEKKLHGKAGEVSKHVAKLHKENVFYRFAKELQENKTAGTEPTFTDNNVGEMVRKSDVPAYLRKAKGDTPLTMADVKAPKKDTISDPKNLAKANEAYDVPKIAPKPFKGDKDSLKSSLKRPKLTTGLRQSKISPGETEVYIKNDFNREEVELHESLMSHIEVKPARKHKDPEILAVHDVHYKGKKIGDIEVYHHRSGMKYGSTHDATGNSTAGHRTMDQAIDDIRQEHAQHLKSMKEEVDESVQTQPSKSADKITTDTLDGRMPGGKLNSFKNYKVDLTTSGTEAVPKEFDNGVDTKEKQKVTTSPGPIDIKMDDKLAKKSTQKEEFEAVEEKVIAGMSGFKKIKGADEKGNVTDKSGAVHTPMSRAKDAAKLSFAKLKQEMLGKISN